MGSSCNKEEVREMGGEHNHVRFQNQLSFHCFSHFPWFILIAAGQYKSINIYKNIHIV